MPATPLRAIALVSLAGLALFGLTLSAFSAPPAADPSDDGARAAVQAALVPPWQAGAVTRRGDWALVAVAAVPATDPLTALAHWTGAAWEVALPGDRAYVAWLQALSPGTLAEGERDFLLSGVLPATAVFSQGYRLPWVAAQMAYVTQGSHSGHLNQIDFDLQGAGVSGPIVAGKSGTIAFVKESSNSGCADISCWEQANVVVVRHAADEYSWYFHLAYQSVPDTLGVGSVVTHGTVIGVEGATGYATGVHLHYMVSSAIPAVWPDPNNPNEAPWPPAGSIVEQDWCEARMALIDWPDILWSGNAEEAQAGVMLYRGARCGMPAELFAQDDPDLGDNPVITYTAAAVGLSADWAARLYPLASYAGAFTQLTLEAPDLSLLPIGIGGARSLRVGRTCSGCPGFTDVYEPDDTFTAARVLTPGWAATGHTFWIAPDVDWARFDAVSGTAYLLFTSRLGPRADTVLGLYDIDGTTLITENDDISPGYNPASLIRWTAPATGTYYLRVRPFGPEHTGIDTDYDLMAARGYPQLYMPLLAR